MAKTILTPFQQAVLALLGQNAALSKRFYLSGGTALAEFYLQHRYSEDLDLFSEEEFNLIPIQAFLRKISPKLKITKIEYRNFLGLHTFFLHQQKQVLKVDFNYYPFPRIEQGKKINGLFIDSLRDIAINKLQTIVTQPRSRDFIDLYCIIQKTGWIIEDLRREARIKFDHFVDNIHLGSRFLMVDQLKDYPKLINPLDEKEWQDYFKEQARQLGQKIIEK